MSAQSGNVLFGNELLGFFRPARAGVTGLAGSKAATRRSVAVNLKLRLTKRLLKVVLSGLM